MLAPWLLLATLAHADVLRATVELDDAGAVVRVAHATVLPGDALSEPGPIEVLSTDGRVLASGALPVLARYRDVPLPGGGGEAGLVPTRYVRLDLPWPEGAHTLRADGVRALPLSPQRVAPPPPGTTAVISSGPSSKRLDLVFFAEGYPEGTEDDFDADVDRMVDHVLSLEPYSAYAGVFNTWKVWIASPDEGIDASEDADLVDTPFECAYGCTGIQRLICCDEARIADLVDTHAPFADGVMLLVNSNVYGGSGGELYSTAYTGGNDAPQVAAHELSHSLIGLWDEYVYPGATGAAADYVSPNCVHQDEPIPWTDWRGTSVGGQQSVDRFPGCSFENWDRPTPSACMMSVLQDQWCPVCREAIVRRLYKAVGGAIVTRAEPEAGARVRLTEGESQTFEVEALGPDEGLTYTWTVKDEVVGEGPTFVLDGCANLDGELTLTVQDETPWVRSDPEGYLVDTVTWIVHTKNCEGCGCASTSAAPLPLTALGLALAALRRRSRRC